MRATEFITEAKVPPIRDQIRADVKKNGPGEYFVRVTAVDKLGFSARQKFGHSPDMDDPAFDVDYIGAGQGRPALWFYPVDEYLKNNDLYATESPYVWLVKLKDTAWLQPARRGATGVTSAPQGKQRVGIMRHSNPPAAIFFEPGFDVVGRYYDYAGQHKRHGQVKGAPKPTFFDRVRGVSEDTETTTEHYNGIEISLEKEDDEILITAMMPGGRELGHVLFVQEGDYLMPQDLEVEERYQGQGIAATMYDYVKSKGYKIRRSGQQTDAGAGFWDKHRPEQNVWEQEIDENFADGKNPGRKGLSRRVGIPKKATLGQLEKIAGSSTGERRRMAQWQLNMRRGKKK